MEKKKARAEKPEETNEPKAIKDEDAVAAFQNAEAVEYQTGFGSGWSGKIMCLPAGFREALSAPLPEEAIKPHPTKSYLSTIKSIFIIERLNSVFGICGWDFEHEIIGMYDNIDYDQNKNEVRRRPYVMAKGRIYIKAFDLYTPTQYGGHDINDRGTEPADGFKSAVTDCLSKCASYLEIGIQVFKGRPKDQTANKTETIDEANFSGLLKKPIAPAEIEPEAELENEEAPKKGPVKKETAKKGSVKKEPVKKDVEEKPEEETEQDQEQEASRDDVYSNLLAEIASYTKKADISAAAKGLMEKAEEAGLSLEQIAEIKVKANARFMELKS